MPGDSQRRSLVWAPFLITSGDARPGRGAHTARLMETPDPTDTPPASPSEEPASANDGVPTRRLGGEPATLSALLSAMQAAEDAVGAAVRRMSDGADAGPADPDLPEN